MYPFRYYSFTRKYPIIRFPHHATYPLQGVKELEHPNTRIGISTYDQFAFRRALASFMIVGASNGGPGGAGGAAGGHINGLSA